MQQPILNPNDMAFLDRFPAKERSTIANRFLDPIRDGLGVGYAKSAESVITAVVAECRKKAANAESWAQRAEASDTEWAEDSAARSWENAAKETRWVMTINAHRDEALRLAEYYLTYEQLPRDQRKQASAASRSRAVTAAVEQRPDEPATEAQLRYLHVLGHRGPAPVTKREASKLISDLKAESGR